MTTGRTKATDTGRNQLAGARSASIVAAMFIALLNHTIASADHRHGDEPGHDHHHHRHHDGDNVATAVSKARTLQQAHRFNEAAIVLDEYLGLSPLDVEAQLLYADVLRHAGRLDESRNACVRVALAGSSTLAAYCAVQVFVAEGDYESADEISLRYATSRTKLPDAAYQWTLEVAAEAAWRNGRIGTAQRLYRSALAFENVPHSTHDAYAEFLDSLGD